MIHCNYMTSVTLQQLLAPVHPTLCHTACIRPSTTAARSSPGSLSLCGISRSRARHTRRLVVHTFCTEMKYVYVARTCHLVALCKQHIPVSTCHNARGSVTHTAQWSVIGSAGSARHDTAAFIAFEQLPFDVLSIQHSQLSCDF